jgi:hypothetical protein
MNALVLILFLANPVVHDIDGQKFVCFDKQWAQELLQLRVDFPKLKQEIETLKSLGDNKDRQIKEYEGLTHNYDQQIVAYSEEVRLLNTQLQNENVWWRSRLFIFGVGVVGGIAASMGIFYLIKASVGVRSARLESETTTRTCAFCMCRA